MRIAGCLPWLWLAPAAIALLLATQARRGETHRRGARVLEGRAARYVARRRRSRVPAHLALARVPLTPADERRHFKVIGTTGTGKSTAIAGLMSAALARGDRAVIADPDGGYRRRFFDRRRGDVILNPFDADSVRWDPFAELRCDWDVEQLSCSLIAGGEDANAREWRGYARTLLCALLRACRRSGCPDLAELWRLLTVAPVAELRPLLAGSAAQPFLDPDNARMFSSIRSVAGAAAAALQHLQYQRSRGFAIRDWVSAGRGVLFMPYAATQIAALRSIVATWLRLAIFTAMEHPEHDQRLWFVVDEIDALGTIEGLKDALARLRKFGGRCILGFQSLAQVSATYGAGDAQTIIENCATTLILRCSGSEHGGTSQFAARLIGEREVLRRQTVHGHDHAGWLGSGRRSSSVSVQHAIELAVLPAQIEQLPDFCGYLKTASAPQWLRVRVPRG